MANVAFFDMNETTLDLDPLDFLFDAWFPNKGVRRAWFQRLLHTTMMTIIVGPRKPFGELAGSITRCSGRCPCRVTAQECNEGYCGNAGQIAAA